MKDDNIDLVLFGAAGDLSRRKLLPALMHLDFSGLLAPDLRILALSREDMSTEQFMAGQEQTLKAYLGEQRWSQELWQSVLWACGLCASAVYRCQPIRLAIPAALVRAGCHFLLCDATEFVSNHLRKFEWLWLSYGTVTGGTGEAHWTEPCELQGGQRNRRSFFEESRIYRIDHYLGKETVQNLLGAAFC